MKRVIFIWLAIAAFLWLCAAPYTIAGTVTYGYDDAGRLIRAIYGDKTEITYTYDAAGNLLSRVTGPPGQDTTLASGWNLISLSQQPSNTSIASVLVNIIGKFVSVWAYIDGNWRVYDPNNPGFSDLTTMEAGRGYWLNTKESTTLSISGSTPSTSIELGSGWNLVGYNSSTSQAIANALASIAGKYISVWAYKNGSWKVYDPNNPGFSDLTTMGPGYGFWINATEACTWTLP
jgi:YD repeat-containing protein